MPKRKPRRKSGKTWRRKNLEAARNKNLNNLHAGDSKEPSQPVARKSVKDFTTECDQTDADVSTQKTSQPTRVLQRPVPPVQYFETPIPRGRNGGYKQVLRNVRALKNQKQLNRQRNAAALEQARQATLQRQRDRRDMYEQARTVLQSVSVYIFSYKSHFHS